MKILLQLCTLFPYTLFAFELFKTDLQMVGEGENLAPKIGAPWNS